MEVLLFFLNFVEIVGNASKEVDRLYGKILPGLTFS